MAFTGGKLFFKKQTKMFDDSFAQKVSCITLDILFYCKVCLDLHNILHDEKLKLCFTCHSLKKGRP